MDLHFRGTCYHSIRCGLNVFPFIIQCPDFGSTFSASVAYFFIPDYPSTAKFLTPAEKVEVIRRLETDNNGLSKEFDKKFIWDAFTDWKVYAYSTSPPFNFLRVPY